MATKRIKLTFPQELIKEPVIFTMAKKFEVMPNIRRAKVTESVGEVVLELEGSEKNLEAGMAYLKERGVKIDAVEGETAS
jgi:ABC-type methionine transport system ATPase subunit